MFTGPARLSILAAVLTFGAAGVALALTGIGIPYALAAALAAVMAALVLYVALLQQPPPDRTMEHGLVQQLEAYRAATAGLRHDIRGVLSPALMMSDRLLRHQDPSVQRAGQAVVRSIDRATALLSANRDLLSGKEQPTPETPAA